MLTLLREFVERFLVDLYDSLQLGDVGALSLQEFDSQRVPLAPLLYWSNELALCGAR